MFFVMSCVAGPFCTCGCTVLNTHRSFKCFSLAKWSGELGLRSGFDSEEDLVDDEVDGVPHTGRSLEDHESSDNEIIAIRKDFPETWMFQQFPDIGYKLSFFD